MSQLPDSKNQKRQHPPSAQFLEVLEQEMALTSETMNQEISKLQSLGYIEALADMSPDQLRAGFKRARRILHFFPKPVEVRELAFDEIEENRPKRYYLPEADPSWTDEERKEFIQQISDAVTVNSCRPWSPPIVSEEKDTYILVVTDEMRLRAIAQKLELQKKHPEMFKDKAN